MDKGFDGMTELKDKIQELYEIKTGQVKLFRSMIGLVYIVGENDYVFKVYRKSNYNSARKSVDVLNFLKSCNFPAAVAIPDKDGEFIVNLPTQKGVCAGVMFEYIRGTEPDKTKDIRRLGEYTGELHNIMKGYSDKIDCFPKEIYLYDFIALLAEKGFCEKKTHVIKLIADELWDRIKDLPKGFCHGDFHTGNIIRDSCGIYRSFDFDECSCDFPVMDIASICDASSFNNFKTTDAEKTAKLVDEFLKGYGKYNSVNERELTRVNAFILIRHFQIIARIARNTGLDRIRLDFLEQQYNWILKGFENWKI